MFEDVLMTAHVFGATRKEPEEMGIFAWPCPEVKVACPRYKGWGYDRTPGCKATVKGREMVDVEDEDDEKPDGKDSNPCG